MQTNMANVLKRICMLIFSVLILAANDCYSSSNQDEIDFINKYRYFDEGSIYVSPDPTELGDPVGCCLSAIKFTMIDLFSGDYVCNLQTSDKKSLCKIIGTTLLKEIFKEEFKNGKIEDIKVQDTNLSCTSKSLYLFFNRDLEQRMLPCAITFKMDETDKFLPFYVSRTYKWQMPSFLKNNRNVFVYVNNKILNGKKIQEEYLLKQKSIDELDEAYAFVTLVGESSEFSFDSKKLKQRAGL